MAARSIRTCDTVRGRAKAPFFAFLPRNSLILLALLRSPIVPPALRV